MRSYSSIEVSNIGTIGKRMVIHLSDYTEEKLNEIEGLKDARGFMIAVTDGNCAGYNTMNGSTIVDMLDAATKSENQCFFLVFALNTEKFTKVDIGRVEKFIVHKITGDETSVKGMSANAKELALEIDAAIEIVNKAYGIVHEFQEDDEVSDEECTCGCCEHDTEESECECTCGCEEDCECECNSEDDDDEDDEDMQEIYEDGFEDGFEHGFDKGFDKGYARAMSEVARMDKECECDSKDIKADAFMAGFDYAIGVINAILEDPDFIPGDRVITTIEAPEYGVNTEVEIEIDAECDCCDCEDEGCDCECHDCGCCEDCCECSESEEEAKECECSECTQAKAEEELAKLLSMIIAANKPTNTVKAVKIPVMGMYPFFPFF